MHLCMDFKIILRSCYPQGGELPFEKIFLGTLKVKVTGVK